MRRFSNRFIRRIEAIHRSQTNQRMAQKKSPKLLEVEISMSSDDGKDWHPAAFPTEHCDFNNSRNGDVSRPRIEDFRFRNSPREFWNEEDVNLYDFYNEYERRVLRRWLDTMYLSYSVVAIEWCFVNFMKKYDEENENGT